MSRLVLFDLDGTLVDSSPGIHASVRVAVAALGLRGGRRRRSCGRWWGRRCRRASPRVRAPGADVDRAIAAYRAHYWPARCSTPRRIPASRNSWRGCGPTRRCSQSPRASPTVRRRILEHVGLLGYFSSVHGATLDGTVRHKDQVVGAALAEHPEGLDPFSSATAHRTSSAPPRTVCRASAPAGVPQRTASSRRPARR